jgi:hypothetical protein
MTPKEAMGFIQSYFAVYYGKMYDLSHDPDMAWLVTQGSEQEKQLLEAICALDLYLTDRTDCRRDSRDLEDAHETIQSGETWVVYLSDGGYSRLVIRPDSQVPIWLIRSLSLDKPKKRAQELGVPLL